MNENVHSLLFLKNMLGHDDTIHNLEIGRSLSSTLMSQVITDMLSALLQRAIFSALYLG